MQKTLQKLNFEDIIDFYKSNESFKKTVGLEYERISTDKKTYLQADFSSLYEIIRNFSILNDFEPVYDNETIIGAKNIEGSSLSLEPGGQFEISLAPKKDLYEIQFLMANYIKQIDILGEKFGVKFFAIGNNPKTCYQDMQILPKRRYQIMADYLVKKGEMAPVMMRETAGVQVNIDYENEIDALRKIKVSCLMSPFLTGLFANSPFRGGKLTPYKSIRAFAWKYTGSDRCNLFYKNLIDKSENLYECYTNYILDVPMIFIVRDDKYINLDGKITFREFMERGYEGYSADLEDYKIHQSLCFPDVRLKNCIEIRNHDSQNLEVAIAIAGIYKGLLYNNCAIDEILDFLAPLNSSSLEKYGFLAAEKGINFEVSELKMSAVSVIKKILYLAQYSLDINEQKYLDWLIDLATSKRCIADLVLENIKNNS